MNDVIRLLKTRCDFEHLWAPVKYIEKDPHIIRPLPDFVKRHTPPQDLVEFYQRYDGGRQVFSYHGWPDCPGPARLTLYRLDDMGKRKAELYKDAAKSLEDHAGATGYSLLEATRFRVQLASSFQRFLLIGEIGAAEPAGEKRPLSYLLCSRGRLYVMERELFSTLGLQSLKDCLSAYCERGDAIHDTSLAELLDKVLDILLMNRYSLSALNEEQRMLRERAERQAGKQTQPRGRPLYRLIAASVVNGALPADFSLPKEPGSPQSLWADGALDGVSLYHMAPQEVEEEQKGLLFSALDCADSGLTLQAEAQLRELSKKSRALPLRELIWEYVMDHREEALTPFLHAFGVILAMSSDNTECVKMGLSILAVFKPGEKTKDVVRTLALCDEFTYFALFVMSTWENGNREVFEATKKVRGWGRIHGVRVLEPDSGEIRRWLLREGIKNDVLPAYSALECWNKSGAAELLTGSDTLSREDFVSIRDLIGALLDEAPAPGISAVEDGEDCILEFLDRAAQETLSAEDMGVIRELEEHYSEEEHESPQIAERCRELLDEF